MNIWELIGQAYAAPFERRRAAVTVFRLPGVLWLAAWFGFETSAQYLDSASSTTDTSAGVAYVIGFIVLFCYQSIVMASALIRWHLHLIARAQPCNARLWLSRQECPYWWRWFYLGVVATVLALAILTIFIALAPDALSNNAGADDDATLLVFAIPWILVLSAGLMGWLFPRKFLSLAAIALGEDEAFRANGKKIVTKADCSALALGILLATAPFLLASTTIAAWFAAPSASNNPLSLTFGYELTSLASCMLDFLAMVVFASLLSLFYRVRVAERRPPDALSPQPAVE